jgi:hypothetical protein
MILHGTNLHGILSDSGYKSANRDLWSYTRDTCHEGPRSYTVALGLQEAYPIEACMTSLEPSIA